MVVIKSVSAKEVPDSRGEKTILVSIKTNAGDFGASAPMGKSRGKNEAEPYKKTISDDIKKIKDFSGYFSKENIDKFDDLKRIEDIIDRQVGANTSFALESAVLKALAKEQKREIWQLINPSAENFPRLAGNCIGGGMHSKTSGKKPDFQEFLLVPETNNIEEAFAIMKTAKEQAGLILKKEDGNFTGKKNDEDAWITSLTDKSVLDILGKLSIPLGIDAASSTFFRRKKYHYNNPVFNRTDDEHFSYISSLIDNCDLFYIEDPFDEEDFKNFAKLRKKYPDRLIVGDDLTTTNYNRLSEAIKNRSVNALIVKPNQIGFLTEVKRVCKLAKDNNIKLVFSHRSGETEENIIADLAFGFGADFFKCGITGKEREVKIKRL
ncbi:MAG TPA: enolase C-terminal domain-like protein, partial [Candidatus Omnitrophota bacterium]|nr:enolase C-terminal domain-like protein [Candidatus Omnitrophota bacterium]